MIASLILAAVAGTAPGEADLVDATTVVPGLVLDLRYATDRNFLKRKVYPVARCLLHKDVAARLARVQAKLVAEHLGLAVFDCYRPLSIQKEMWKIKPVKGYVADPATGSNHNRGTAVDVTLVDDHAKPLRMPTDFDAFGHAAHHGAQVDLDAARNRDHLKAVMESEGFHTIKMEWWHFDAPNPGRYPVLDVPLDAVAMVKPDQPTAPPSNPASLTPASAPASRPASIPVEPASSK